MRALLVIIVAGLASYLLAQAEPVKNGAEKHRIITKADIAKLPDKMTVAQLFRIWYPVHLPDPPLFMYPSDIEDHIYFVVAHPDDSDELARGSYEKVRVRSIFLFKYTYKTKFAEKPVWGEAPFIEPVIRATQDPFGEPKNQAEQDGADQPATAPESKSEGKKKPQPKSEGRSQ